MRIMAKCPLATLLVTTIVILGAMVVPIAAEIADTCIICSAGTFAGGDEYGDFDCFDVCPVGLCPQTDFQDGPKCTICPIGSISSRGATECRECPDNTTSSTDHTACIGCRAGTTSHESGCKPCEVGTFGSSSGAGCAPCSKGSFQSHTGQLACTACPEGTFSGNRGNTKREDCERCPAGSYCPQGAVSGAVEHIICPVDAYCPPGSHVPLLCPALFVSTSGSTACNPSAAFFGVIAFVVVAFSALAVFCVARYMTTRAHVQKISSRIYGDAVAENYEGEIDRERPSLGGGVFSSMFASTPSRSRLPPRPVSPSERNPLLGAPISDRHATTGPLPEDDGPSYGGF